MAVEEECWFFISDEEFIEVFVGERAARMCDLSGQANNTRRQPFTPMSWARSARFDRQRLVYRLGAQPGAAGTKNFHNPMRRGRFGLYHSKAHQRRLLCQPTELLHRVAVLYAGSAANPLAFYEVTTGAADNPAKATDIAEVMVTR